MTLETPTVFRGIKEMAITDYKGGTQYIARTGAPLLVGASGGEFVTEFSHWGENLGLTAPPADQVVDGSKLSKWLTDVTRKASLRGSLPKLAPLSLGV